MVGFAVGGRGGDAPALDPPVRYWLAIAGAAAVAVLLVIPAFLPYVTLQRVGGFRRELKDAVQYSANWSDYPRQLRVRPHLDVEPPAGVVRGVVPRLRHADLRRVGRVRDGTRSRPRAVPALYGGLTLLAFWASFGPGALLYSALYRVVPMFTWLRAPARFGVDRQLRSLGAGGIRDRSVAAAKPAAGAPCRRN